MPPWTVSKNPTATVPYGFIESLGSGVNISGSASANTKGSYGEIIPSLDVDADGFYLFVSSDTISNTNNFLMDIGIGAGGSEIVLVSNIPFQAGRTQAMMVHLPITVPKGSRLTARCQSNLVGSNNRGLRVAIVASPRVYTGSIANKAHVCRTYGALDSTVSKGLSVNTGATACALSSYFDLAESTGDAIHQLLLFFFFYNDSVGSNLGFFVDVAVGAAGSEQIILGDIPVREATLSDSISPMVMGPIPVNIPKGSRLAVRGRCNGNGNNVVDVIAIGIS